jgi:hypothetical protein
MTRQIEISDETYEKIKDQLSQTEQVEISGLDDLVGKKWFFRCIPFHWVGRVKSRIGDIFELESASWVADSGRFMQAIEKGKLSEVEPVGQVFINIKAVCDFVSWKHDLPKEQK